MITTIVCECGTEIYGDSVSYKEGVNDEGKEYYDACAECPLCGSEWRTSEWGDGPYVDDTMQAIADRNNLEIERR